LHYEAIEKLKHDHEKNLMATQLEIQEDTFQQVSREIHDNICLTLTLAKLQLNILQEQENSQKAGMVRTSIDLIGQSLGQLSNISKSLNSNLISSQGLVKALDFELERIRSINAFAINYQVSGDPVYLDAKTELIIFRIVQEAFNNIIKHAKASHTDLLLTYDTEALTVTVKDNGVGFSQAGSEHNGYLNNAGLRNMEARSIMIGSDLHIESSE
jgi:signal transduction histidine kinase